MTKLATLNLTGVSGSGYTFNVYPFDTVFAEIAALYAVTKRNRGLNGDWTHTVIYIGQTDNLTERFNGHHKADCFERRGANSVCVHSDNNERSRFDKETDLVKAYNPACNR